MTVNNKQLKEFIADSGLVPRTELDLAEKQADESKAYLGNILVSGGKLSEDDLRRTEAYILGIPFVSLKEQKIDFEVLSLIPEPIARKNNIVAFKKTTTALEVAMLDTDDLGAIEFVKKKVGLKILPRLTDKESIKSVLLQYQKSLKAEFGDIIEKEAGALKMVAEGDEPQSEEDLKKLAEDLPVVKIVDTLLNHAIIQGASDIHIEPLDAQVVIRYRIDGILHDAMVLPKTAAAGIVARVKVLANLKLDEKRLPQDGRFKIESAGEKVAFRVSTLPVYYGEKTVMRLLRESVSGFTLEGLGFSGVNLERIHDAMKQRVGMILTTGPTGSGKSTTLYTILDLLNEPDVNISTIEDPIEYQMSRVNQTQVKAEIGLTFASGLRTLMRQDPDIIMVGEIRDNETASLAVNAALTGHLVLSTLHTNSAASTMPRLIDMDIEPFLIVSTVNVIISQRLVRRLTAVKEKYLMSPEELEMLKKSVDLDRIMKVLKTENIVAPEAEWKDVPFYRPKKTEESDDGYKGRVGIHEVLKMSPAIRDLVIKGATSATVEEHARKEGMNTMLEDGIVKSVQGLTTIEEVFRVVSE
ncbi:MAG: Tfp pilus assembly protein PilB [Parcubacteria group bacterium GW2011_GWA1_44_13]|uniref:Tfp pilus assembly protein PilB n=1 Tax=Candidatus Nomurabacteria bacterium GW2011_GWB1_44_12 TaxID=1618748 RepID=A0A837II98_9BACT|nr:MAG: Tfp pilus assembly protein PilB [Candidatus Nomurabacteria bacterium GW2011_GWD1_44_10]KKT36894.1 MAG: Tfp pilus assembly protein PilB [Candidatus Nomurabacteria bacterium GW2011_GWB1_44_12]KKT37898.1 MAG: Tfp pilus assembly protein PilB [Parcubacteria group bacterium GW2011_GWA1_44_13]